MMQLLKANVGKSLANGPSPLSAWLGSVLVDVRETGISIEYEIRREMCNPAMILQGGIATAMMDEAMGVAAFALAGSEVFYSTINLAVDFLAAAQLGEKVVAHSEVVRKGKNVMHFECKLLNSHGRIIAKCSSNLITTARKIG